MTSPASSSEPTKRIHPELTLAVDRIYQAVLNRLPSPTEQAAVAEAIAAGSFTLEDFALRTTLKTEFLERLLGQAQRHHLHALHAARLKLIRWFLPAGKRILDVGGANGSMLEYGYPHSFDELLLTDIPPDERIPELRDIDLARRWAERGNVRVVYTSMADLSAIPNDSLDLVWVGQVVEHITEDDLKISMREIRRVLKPGGHFCFDTPNGILTRIHSPDRLIHPEHKKEYRPDELRTLIAAAGFEVIEELGIAPMPRTYRTKVFSYEEMVLNTGFSRDLESCYLQYFNCQKPNSALMA